MNERRALGFGLSAVLLWSTVATAFKLTLAELTPIHIRISNTSSGYRFTLLIQAHLNGAAGGTITASGVFPILNFLIQYLYFLLILTAKKHYFGSPKNFCD